MQVRHRMATLHPVLVVVVVLAYSAAANHCGCFDCYNYYYYYCLPTTDAYAMPPPAKRSKIKSWPVDMS
jgi:hypothetical protein